MPVFSGFYRLIVSLSLGLLIYSFPRVVSAENLKAKETFLEMDSLKDNVLFQESSISTVRALSSNSSHLQKIKPLRLKFKLPGEGIVKAVFTIRNTLNPNISIDGKQFRSTLPLLLQGKARIGRASQAQFQEDVPVTLDVINGYVSIHIVSSKQTLSERENAYTIKSKTIRKKKLKARVSRVPKSALGIKSCGSEHDHSHSDQSQLNDKAALDIGTLSGNIKLLKLDLLGDAEWFSIYGGNSAQEILAIVNSADPIYRRDIGLGLVVEDIEIVTSNPAQLVTTNTANLLPQFKDYSNTNPIGGSAVVGNRHLLSGKDFDSNIVGRAYIGTACGSFSAGITQRLSTSTYLVFAHELGHNMNMQHVNDGGIMNSSLNYQTFFSSTSVAEGSAFVTSASPACMPIDNSVPTPTPTATPLPPDSEPTTIPTVTPTATFVPVEPTIEPAPTPPVIIPIIPQPSASLDINLKLRKRDIILKGTLAVSGVPMAATEIKLLRNNKAVKTKRTNAKGNYQFQVPKNFFGRYKTNTLIAGGKINSSTINYQPGSRSKRR